MCYFRDLFFDEDLHVTQCQYCGLVNVAYRNSFLSFEAREFFLFHQYLCRVTFRHHASIAPDYEPILFIPSHVRGFSYMFNEEDWLAFKEGVDEAVFAAKILDLFKPE